LTLNPEGVILTIGTTPAPVSGKNLWEGKDRIKDIELGLGL